MSVLYKKRVGGNLGNSVERRVYILLFFVVFSFALGFAIKYFSEINCIEEVTNVVKTVAHVEFNDPDYELIYSNTKEDVAYYRYVGNKTDAYEGD